MTFKKRSAVQRYEVVGNRPVEIESVPEGPALLRFVSFLRSDDGGEIPAERALVAVCMCGFSRRRPWCDGSHHLARNGQQRPPILTMAGADDDEVSPRAPAHEEPTA